MQKVSAYISYYHDYDYLNLCLENFSKIVDEIIICDGPFKYMMHDIELLGIPTHMSDQQLEALIYSYKNIKYYKGVFEDEFEKRKYSYNKCSNEIVFLIDSDEMISIKKSDIEDFEKSDACVGYVSFMNLCQLGYCFNQKGSKKSMLFKKSLVSAEDHLDYTWLVGYDEQRKTKNLKIKDYEDIVVYHYSLMRPKESLVVKYLFYINLWYKTNKKINNLFIKSLYNQNIPIEQIKNIFNRSRIEGLGFPETQEINNKWIKNTKLEKQQKKIENLIKNLDFQESDFIASDIPMFGLIPVGKNYSNIIIELEESVDVFEYTLCPIYNNKLEIINKNDKVLDKNKIGINFDKNKIICIRLDIKDKSKIVNKIKRIMYS